MNGLLLIGLQVTIEFFPIILKKGDGGSSKVFLSSFLVTTVRKPPLFYSLMLFLFLIIKLSNEQTTRLPSLARGLIVQTKMLKLGHKSRAMINLLISYPPHWISNCT